MLTVWSDTHRTPRYVWVASAMAATTMNASGIWWITTYWQKHHNMTTAPPIAVIAIPEPAIAADLPQSNASAPVPAPSPKAPVPLQPVTTPDTPISPEIPPATLPSSSPQSSQFPETSFSDPSTPPPSLQTPQTTGEPTPRSTPPIPTPSITEDDSPDTQGGLRIQWKQPELVPGPRDIPEELPQFPQGWQDSVSSLLKASSCFTELTPTDIQITLWPTIEADGRISSLRLFDRSNTPAADNLEPCLQALRPQFPPLIPAKTSGAPIATYVAVIILEVSFTE